MSVRILTGDCRQVLQDLPSESVHCVVTSPPYFGLRDYGHADQIGIEATPDEFVDVMVLVFREVRRVLRGDGTLWLNLGDSYSTDSKWGGATGGKAAKALHGLGGGGRNKTNVGLPDKNLIGIPWKVAFALQADGWYLRQDIIWHKPNPMPESVTDRCTKSHEHIFLLSKNPRYYFDQEAIKEPSKYPNDDRKSRQKSNSKSIRTDEIMGLRVGSATYEKRRKRDVWTVPSRPYAGAHFATFPADLVEPCVLAGCPVGGTVLDPFGGAGTTGLVSSRLNRNSVLIELNPEYAAMAEKRIFGDAPLLIGDAA